jgi:xanthine dehydrogenase accessory factor
MVNDITPGPGGGPIFEALRRALHAETPVALCTITDGPGIGAKLLVPADPEAPVLGTLGDPELDRVVVRDSRGLLGQGLTEIRRYGAHGEGRMADVAVFVESFAPPPRLIVFGAIDFTRGLCRVGKVMGYRVTVCDARSMFATRARFPEADEVIVDWPHRFLEGQQIDERTVICVLTHDAKFDVPALKAAVATPAVYIGAMGSRRTHADRVVRLREAGLTDAEIARISAPIGLDIGARTPEETAVSVLAEVVALRAGRPGGRLAEGDAPIHPR